MPLRYVLDEHLRGPWWRAIQWHNSRGVYPLDATRVGDADDLPLGIEDPGLLVWSETQDRIIVTHDPDTMPAHLADHLKAGTIHQGYSWFVLAALCRRSSRFSWTPPTLASRRNGQIKSSSFLERCACASLDR